MQSWQWPIHTLALSQKKPWGARQFERFEKHSMSSCCMCAFDMLKTVEDGGLPLIASLQFAGFSPPHTLQVFERFRRCNLYFDVQFLHFWSYFPNFSLPSHSVMYLPASRKQIDWLFKDTLEKLTWCRLPPAGRVLPTSSLKIVDFDQTKKPPSALIPSALFSVSLSASFLRRLWQQARSMCSWKSQIH